MQTIQKFCSSEAILAPWKWMWKAFTRSGFRILHVAHCVCARFCFFGFFRGEGGSWEKYYMKSSL